MSNKDIIAVFSQIHTKHTKHTNTLCGQNVELLNVKLVVHIVTTGLIGLGQETNGCFFNVKQKFCASSWLIGKIKRVLFSDSVLSSRCKCL